MIKLGKVNFPIFDLIKAIPGAIKKARAVAADDKDAGSPGGAKITAGEVMEAITAFLAALGEAILPSVLKANGVSEGA